MLHFFLCLYFTAIIDRLEPGMPSAGTSSDTKTVQQNTLYFIVFHTSVLAPLTILILQMC